MNSPENPDHLDIEGFTRRIRPGALHAVAFWNSVFPPESPTTARRGGNKQALDQSTRDAVCAILDSMLGYPGDPMTSEFQAAMKSADAGFFRMMAQAAEHVKTMPHAHSVFAKHVISARRIAAEMMTAGCPLPSWREVRKRVSSKMGQEAYSDASPEWSRVKRAAGLTDLPR